MGNLSPLPDRFWIKVNKTEACWLWTAFRDEQGYGKFARGGAAGGMARAHRLTYEAFVGPIPHGMYVDHLCHVRHCVNPDHLKAVTPRQNSENRAGASKCNPTGVRGVRRRPNSASYEVRVFHAGKAYNGGCFRLIEEAEAAAVALRNRLMTNNAADRGLAVEAVTSSGAE